MGRVRRAWRKGVREEPAFYVLHLGHRLEPGGSGPGAVRPAAREGGGDFREVYESRTGRPWGKPAAYPWRCCWDTAGLLIRRANRSEHGNRLVLAPGGGHPA